MIRHALLVAAGALLLAGCGEKEQTASGSRNDAAPYQGTSRPFMATGWTPGDRAAWEQQLKVRTVQGQNEYVKVR